jgi:hypothetical protein
MVSELLADLVAVAAPQFRAAPLRVLLSKTRIVWYSTLLKNAAALLSFAADHVKVDVFCKVDERAAVSVGLDGLEMVKVLDDQSDGLYTYTVLVVPLVFSHDLRAPRTRNCTEVRVFCVNG